MRVQYALRFKDHCLSAVERDEADIYLSHSVLIGNSSKKACAILWVIATTNRNS